MQIAIISPTKYLKEFSSLGDLGMCIGTTCLESMEYLEYYKNESKRDRHVILDNGIFETGESLSAEQIINLAKEINPQDLVTPEKMKDKKGTLELLEDFIQKLTQQGLLKKWPLLAVIQGSTPEELIDCFTNFLKRDNISTIGIPNGLRFWKLDSFSDTNNQMLNRLNLMLEIRKVLWGHDYNIKPKHLMGCSNPFEIFLQTICNKLPFVVRSQDSSSAFVHGIHGIKFEIGKGLPCEKLSSKIEFHSTVTLDDESYNNVTYNINILNKYREGLLA